MLDKSLQIGHQGQKPLELLGHRLNVRKLIGETHEAHVHRGHAVLVEHRLMPVHENLLNISLQLDELLRNLFELRVHVEVSGLLVGADLADFFLGLIHAVTDTLIDLLHHLFNVRLGSLICSIAHCVAHDDLLIVFIVLVIRVEHPSRDLLLLSLPLAERRVGSTGILVGADLPGVFLILCLFCHCSRAVDWNYYKF